MSNEPRTLTEAIRHFSDPDVALKTMVHLRWPHGVHCPTCGRVDVRFIATRRIWECKEKHPKKQFSVKVGTIFEDSPLGLDKWLVAIWTIANCKNGISSYELHRAIGVTQKSAWHMLHRIRVAMKVGGIEMVDGITEIDESYVGGKKRNMHLGKRDKVGTGGAGKALVAGVLKRGDDKSASRVRAMLIPDTTTPILDKLVRDHVAPGSAVMTDAHSGYRKLSDAYVHAFVNHTTEYVRGAVHTNGIENFWSLLKRALRGTYVSVDPAHLLAYCDEQAFRFNERKSTDGERFRMVAGSVSGKRLTYKELTGRVETALPA
jgi:transposase-like protein